MDLALVAFFSSDQGIFLRRGKQWFRYDVPDKPLFKQLLKTLTAP